MPVKNSPVWKIGSPTFISESAIDSKHNTLGGDSGLLGAALGDVTQCPDKVGYFRRYANGMIYWTPTTGAFEIHGSNLAKWSAMGYERSLLGYPVTDETGTPDGVGRFNRFQGGMIYWTPSTGSFEVHGSILAKWSAMGYERSLLGYPVTDESGTPDGVGRFNRFEGGMIYWTPSTGAFEIHGSILAKWSAMGYERSLLGYPVTDETGTPDGVGRFNRFQGGMIYWTPSTNAFEVHGSILDKWSSMGYERSALGYPTSDESGAMENGRVSDFQNGQIYWWPDIGTVVNMGAPLNSKPGDIVNLSGPIIFPDGVAITASYNIAITPAGDISASTHAHCSSEIVTYDYGVVILITTPAGITVGVQHGGHVSNPIIGTANDDNWTSNRNEPIISGNWDQFRQATVANIGKTSDTQVLGQSLNDLLQQALQAAGKAAVEFLLS